MLDLALIAVAKLMLFVALTGAYHLAIERDLYELTSLPRATLVRSRRRAYSAAMGNEHDDDVTPVEIPHPIERHRCGRRDDMVNAVASLTGLDGATPDLARGTGPDTWRTNTMEHPGSTGAGQRACNYCGSMHPDDLFAAIATGAELGPTDKSYKMYVKLADGRHHKFYFQHFDRGEQQKFLDLLITNGLKIGMPGYFYVRPFFISKRA